MTKPCKPSSARLTQPYWTKGQSTRHRKRLARQLTINIYAGLIEHSPANPPAIRRLHLHWSSIEMHALAQYIAETLAADPTIKITLHKPT